jgi:hypothetical protein
MKITLNLITFALLVQTLWNDKLHTILSRDFDNKKSIVEGPTIWSGMVTSQQANTHIYVCVCVFLDVTIIYIHMPWHMLLNTPL